jgi:hypothetical protein
MAAAHWRLHGSIFMDSGPGELLKKKWSTEETSQTVKQTKEETQPSLFSSST